jgi:hypothetical protein
LGMVRSKKSFLKLDSLPMMFGRKMSSEIETRGLEGVFGGC